MRLAGRQDYLSICGGPGPELPGVKSTFGPAAGPRPWTDYVPERSISIPDSHFLKIAPHGSIFRPRYTKRFQESMTMAYHRFHKIETRIVRIFNTYGPRMRLNDGRVIPAFMGQALRGEDLTVFGDGSQTRSFCYVDDLIEGIYRLLLSNYTLPVNIGNPVEISIKEFAEEIIKLTQTKQKIIYKDLPVNDPLQRQPDITLAKEILNWKPEVNRAEGMNITLVQSLIVTNSTTGLQSRYP